MKARRRAVAFTDLPLPSSRTITGRWRDREGHVRCDGRLDHLSRQERREKVRDLGLHSQPRRPRKRRLPIIAHFLPGRAILSDETDGQRFHAVTRLCTV
jgi:hypothetical protein